MTFIPDSFCFDYRGSEVRYGSGAVENLDRILGERGLSRALVITGSNVGANPDVMEPIRNGLGDRLAGVFDRTTPDKRAETLFDVIECLRSLNIDVVVGVGGGSSLDIARQTCLLKADGRSINELREAAATGEVNSLSPTDSTIPAIVIPTTFAGAGLSDGGTFEVLSSDDSPTDHPVRIGGSLQPIAVVYDPDLFATTPRDVLNGSAMNGFNKGIETLYSPDATPITDATAVRGLRLFRMGLRRLDNRSGLVRAVVGLVLVQFERKVSFIHAIGHGLTRFSDLQQGIGHAIVTPTALRFVFDQVDARREIFAEAMDLDPSGHTEDEVSKAIIETIESIRDSLEIPTRLRDTGDFDEADLGLIAEYVMKDRLLDRGPVGLNPTVEDIQAVLRAAW